MSLEMLGIMMLVFGIGELVDEKEFRKMIVWDDDVFYVFFL